MSDLAIGQIVIFLTTILGFMLTAWKENRNRQWASADRAAATAELIAAAKAEAEVSRIRAEAEATLLKITGLKEAKIIRDESRDAAERLRILTEATARAVQADAHAIALALEVKVEETKAAAHEAYKEANNVNLKISDLNERLVAQDEVARGMVDKTHATLQHVEALITAHAPDFEQIKHTGTTNTDQLTDIQDHLPR